MRRAPYERVSVVVPTYRRPVHLRRCLEGIAGQTLAPLETIVVRREVDDETRAVLRDTRHGVAEVVVREPGVLAAMNAGVDAARGDIIAFIDDDAVPHVDWLQRLIRHFEASDVGAVGGRDIIAQPSQPAIPTTDVGRVSKWGKLIGNHHRGEGPPRKVMVLKAVTMAFRREALSLPSGLRGSGAQVHFEVGACLSAIRNGWQLVYDPAVVVDHHVAPRFDADRRGRPAPRAVRDAAFNLVTCLVRARPELFWRRAAYGLLIGDGALPGLARGAAAVMRREWTVLADLRPSVCGQLEALWRERPYARKEVESGRLRIALLAHDIHGEGGMEQACLQLLARASSDVDFTVISSRLDPSLRDRVRWIRVPVPRSPFPLKFLTYQLLAGLRLKMIKADVVQTVGAIVPNKVDIASIHFCHAAFMTVHGAGQGKASRVRRLNTSISHRLALIAERWSYRPGRVRMFAPVSEGVARELEAFYAGVPSVVTSNGVDHDRFRPDPDTYVSARAELGVGDSCVALFIGGDWDRKGLATALEGLAYARRTGVDLKLWVVGPGDRPRFETLASELQVRAHVRFFGHRRDTERFYQAADVCVLPTEYETFCIAAFEAAACGLPVVVTPVHGAKDLVGADVAGLCVERNASSVGEALARLARDPAHRAALGAEGRRRSRLFTWSRSVEQVSRAYAAVASQASEQSTSQARKANSQ